MAANYPVPSKASLVQQFVGKSLKEIPLPAAVLDLAVLKRNCTRMLDAVDKLGFALRFQVNSHKTTEITRLQIGDDPEDIRLVVMDMAEAENLLPLLLEYQKKGTRVSVLYGTPIPPSQVDRIASFARIIGRQGGNVRLLVDHISHIPLLEKIYRLSSYPVHVYMHINIGGSSRLRRNSADFRAVLQQLEQLANQDGATPINFVGLHCYQPEGSELEDDEDYTSTLGELNDQLEGLISVSPAQGVRFSVSSIPLVTFLPGLVEFGWEETLGAEPEAFRGIVKSLNELSYQVEIDPGAYAVMDLKGLAHGQTWHTDFSFDDLPLTILTEISSLYAKLKELTGSLEEDRLQPDEVAAALVPIGATILGEHPVNELFGAASEWNIGSRRVEPSKAYPGRRVEDVKKDSAKLEWRPWHHPNDADGDYDMLPPTLDVGQRVMIYPNDAGLASERFGWYFVVDSSRVGKEDEIVDIFVRWRG